MRRLIMAGALVLVSSATLANQLYRPDVQVNVAAGSVQFQRSAGATL